MNCANHPDLPVAAYCQNCGKPLCTQCVRSVAGVVYCEPCLAARLHSPGGFGTPASPGAAAARSSNWSAVPGQPGPVVTAEVFGRQPSPALAGFLGLIPGVGAMYNGQFIKALVHVLVFIFLVGATDHFPLAGMLIAAWVFYQIFDSIQTAIARREGRPLPDPFGLNDLGQRLGVPGSAAAYRPSPVPPASASSSWSGAAPNATTGTAQGPDPWTMPPPQGVSLEEWAHRAAVAKAMQDAGIPVSGVGYDPPAAAAQAASPGQPLYPVAYGGRPEPVGAIVLIVVGMLFLLSTLGVFEWHWIGRGWPIIIIVIGAGMLFRRMRTVPTVGGGM